MNDVQWHDSKLIGFDLQQREAGQRHDIRLALRLLTNAQPGSYEWRDARLELEACRTIALNIDILGMELCGGDLATAFCERADMGKGPESVQIQSFDLPQDEDPLADLLRFRILLIPPGGEIAILAENFRLIIEKLNIEKMNT